MAQNLNELKESVVREIQRTSAEIRSGRAEGFLPQVRSPLNPHAARVDPTFLSDFSTGYDGTVTVVPFTWNLSEWNSGDTWTGS